MTTGTATLTPRQAARPVMIRAGLYRTADGHREIERAFEGPGWHAFEVDDDYRGEYCQTYPTLTDAVEAYAEALEEDQR